jgi:integrase
LIVAPRKIPKLKAFLADYISGRTNVSDHTVYKWTNSAKHFVKFFGDVKIDKITEGDVEDYAEHRRAECAEATVGTEIKHGKQFFGYALKKKLIPENPFEGQKVKRQDNPDRRVYIPRENLQTLIDSVSNPVWKALISIVRWTGCRIGEALLLKWSDIQWEDGKINMPSPKTARYGVPNRMMPLWNELRPILEELRRNAAPESIYVIEDICNLPPTKREDERHSKNTATQLTRYIEAADLDVWPKVWQNIRATRENELELEGHREFAVRAWIGHSQKVAERNYRQITEEDFSKAVKSSSGQIVVSNGTQGSAKPDEQEITTNRKTTLQESAPSCNTSQSGLAPLSKRSS